MLMPSSRRPNWLTLIGLTLCVAGIAAWAMLRYQARQVVVEAAAIYSTLSLQPNSRVADVGAGDGRYGLDLAHAPAAVAADLLTSLRPGGQLAIIDFGPDRWWSRLFPVQDPPSSRRGHGIRPDLVIAELTAAGFRLEEQIDAWGAGQHCLIFSRPPPATQN